MRKNILLIVIILLVITCKDVKDNINILVINYNTKIRILKIEDKIIDFNSNDVNRIINTMGDYQEMIFKDAPYSPFKTYISKLYPLRVTTNEARRSFEIYFDNELSFSEHGNIIFKQKYVYEKIKFYFDDILIDNNSSFWKLKNEFNKRKINYNALQYRSIVIDNKTTYCNLYFTDDGRKITEMEFLFNSVK